MFKLKIYFAVKLLMVVLCAFTISVAQADLCPTIDFNTLSCGSVGSTVTYEVNYENVKYIKWDIEGGEIIQVGDNYSAQAFGQSFCQSVNYDWSQATNFTSISYERTNTGSARFFDNVTQTVMELSQPGNSKFNTNFAKKITVRWNVIGAAKKIRVRGEGLGAAGVCGSSEATKDITFTPYIPATFTLTASNLNPLCTDGVTITGAPGGGTSYNWYSPSATIQQNWDGRGIYISHFTQNGNVPISVVISNQCNSVTKLITLNVRKPDFGHITQNGNIVDDGSRVVVPDCRGDFNLAMYQYVSNHAVYTWELPGDYNNQTNTYGKKIASGRDVRGRLPEGSYTDFVGKVTVTGVCGAVVVKTFIVRTALQPSVDQDIYSCSNSVEIKVNNPNGNSPINAWVTSARPSGWGTFVNANSTSVTFTASNPGDYAITINLTDANGCFKQLYTTVHAVSGGHNTNTGTAGWQSGVLSDNRVKPGSNLSVYNNKIYFAGRDGKIYFYSFNESLQKWVINQIPGVSNAAIPVAGSFRKIGIATMGTTAYLFYTNNGGFINKINLTTNFVDDAFNTSTKSNDFIVTTNEIYAIETGTNTLISNQALNRSLSNGTLKTLIPGNGILYVQNNNLYGTGFSYPLTTSNDVYPSSDVVVYNGYVYVARGQKGLANLFRFPLNNTGAFEQITTTGNLSGIFSINPASGVIYYGIMNKGTWNTIITATSGRYQASDIYQAYQQNGAWKFNAATQVKPRENLDMYIQSPVYGGNHVYYIGAGYNNQIGESYELEVWNLYYENACAPAIQRSAIVTDVEEISAEVNIYPNPFSNTLQLDLSAYTDGSGSQQSVVVTVLDAAGKEIYTTSSMSELSTINTNNWAPGIYMLKITCSNKSVIKKVIKI